MNTTEAEMLVKFHMKEGTLPILLEVVGSFSPATKKAITGAIEKIVKEQGEPVS